MNDMRKDWHMADADKCAICGETDSWKHSLIKCMHDGDCVGTRHSKTLQNKLH